VKINIIIYKPEDHPKTNVEDRCMLMLLIISQRRTHTPAILD